MIAIRPESVHDIPQIHDLNVAAFGQPEEAAIVDKLRERCPDILSLVAEDDGSIVGHILFSPVTLESGGMTFGGMGLAPMAVVPGRQREGLGSMLVREGLKLLRERQCPFVIVLGHPDYYPRFGFERASKYGLTCQWPGVPDEAFMVLELAQHTLCDKRGVARYRDEFDDAM